MERRSQDPFNLNYITPMAEDIFVNPKAAVKALAAFKDLDSIMKEQGASKKKK